MISNYHFGSITINKKTYSHDVEVRWNDEVLSWQRKESHFVDLEDIQRALEQNPEIVIIGTGEVGVAEVSERAKKEILSKGRELIIEKTGQAVEIYNNLNKEDKKVVALFHLTC